MNKTAQSKFVIVVFFILFVLISFVLASTTVILQDAGTEDVANAVTYNSSPTSYAYTSYFKFNITPYIGKRLINASLNVLWYSTLGTKPDTDVNISRIDNQTWTESSAIATYNKLDSQVTNGALSTWSNTNTGSWSFLNVTAQVNPDFLASNSFTSLRFFDPDYQKKSNTAGFAGTIILFGSGANYITYESKRIANTAERPYLSITYANDMVVNSPTSSQIFTQDTPTTIFNITNSTAYSVCYAELDATSVPSSTSTGFKNPSATGEDYNQWTDTTNAYTSNNEYSFDNGDGTQQDYYNFSYSIPAGATITGINVSIEGYTEDSGTSDIGVEMSWNGGTSYTSSGKSNTWTTSEVIKIYGGTSDTWGRTWSSTDFSNANFRLRVKEISTDNDFAMDHVKVNIFYSTSSGTTGKNYTLTNSGDYWTLTNTTMTDKSHTVKYWCNYTGDHWENSSSITFSVDPVNITNCRNLTVARTYYLKNNINSSSDCLVVKASNINLYLRGYTINSTAANAIDIQSASYDNLKVYNGKIKGSGIAFNSVSGSTNNTALNITYISGTDSGAGQVYRKWYLNVQVNKTNGDPLSSATVNVYNTSSILMASELTDANGNIPQKVLIDYYNNGGTKKYWSNYTINVSKATYTTLSRKVNLTLLQNTKQNITLLLSNQAPVAIVKTPVAYYNSSSSKASMICNSTDADSNMKNVTLKLWFGGSAESTNSSTIKGASNSTTFSQTFSNQGTYLWNCYVCDNLSSCDWDSNRTIYIDTVKPKISMVSPVNNTNTTDTGLDVKYKYTELNCKNVTWQDGTGANTTLSSCGTNITTVTWGQGKHNLTINMRDHANNLNQTKVSFTIDTINPKISITYPTNVTYNAIQTELNFSYSDAHTAYCWWSINGGTTNSTHIPCANVTGLNSSQGTSKWLIGIADYAGNKNFSTVTFYTDSGNPTVTLTTPTNYNNLSTASQNLTGSLTDNKGIKNVTLKIYNSTGSLINTTTVSFSGGLLTKTLGIKHTFTDGTWKWFYKVYDWSGNSAQSSNYTLTIDTTAPVVTVLEPSSDGIGYTSGTIQINVSITDATIGLNNCWWTNDSGAINHSITCNTNLSQVLPDNTFTYKFYAKDKLNNIGSDSVNFYISTGPPAITLNTPLADSWLSSGTNVYFNFTATDSDNLSTCKLWHNNTGTWKLNKTWVLPHSGVMNFTVLNLSENGFVWNVWCNDSLGTAQFTPTNRTLHIDDTKPKISYGTGIVTDYGNRSQSFVFVNTTWTEFNFKNITFTLRNKTATINSTTFTSSSIKSMNFTKGLRNDNYTYYVNITDLANNKNSTTIKHVTLDITNPTGFLTVPANNTNSSTANRNLTTSLTDNLGIKNATLKIYNSTGSLINTTTVSFAANLLTKTLGVYHTFTTGVWTWFYKVFDWSGNSAETGNYSITIDITNPVVNQSSYSPSTIYESTNVTVYGNASDTNLKSVWIEVNYSGSYQNFTITTHTGNKYSYTINASVISNHENISWRWWANDYSGRKNSSDYNSFIPSNRNPTTVVITTTNNTFINYNSFLINFSSTDPDGDTLNYTLYNSTNNINFSLFSSTTNGYINFTSFKNTDGTKHYFYVTVNDSFLQNQSNTSVFIIDKTKPAITHIELPYNSLFGSWPVVTCSVASIDLNYSATDTNLDYCVFNVTSGGSTSTANTIIPSCTNVTFSVLYNGLVQTLTLKAVDKAGNVNMTQALIWVDTANVGCIVVMAPGGGGGPVVVVADENSNDKTFCGDNICQAGGNDYGVKESYYSCPVDCPGADLDSVISAFTTNCLDKDPSTTCFFGVGNAKQNSTSVCGDNLCSTDESQLFCSQDCGRLSGKTLFTNCADGDSSTPCFWQTNMAYYIIFGTGLFVMLMFLVKIKTPESDRKVNGYKYVALKIKKSRRRR